VNSREFQDELATRAGSAGITIPSSLAIKLEAYYRLLLTWNRKINLAGMRLEGAPPDAVDRLLIEPILAAAHVPTGTRRIIDIGSGGGSPAIPFALAVQGSALVMVESKVRKSAFLKEALRAVGMEGDVLTSRYESLLTRPELHESQDVLTIRAVRVEAHVLMSLQAFVKPHGYFFLFRSSGDTPELLPPLTWVATHPLIASLHSQLTIVGKQAAP
jgi:16S rRNA (guanine527-N7)-methyltransferase